MLSNLASYLGYQSSSATFDKAAAEVASTLRLKEVEEDEWVLVDPESTGTASGSGSDEDSGTGRVRQAPFLPTGCPLPSRNGPSSTLQESWYITPPPSFSSYGSIHMETSPFENLLIEHPSMSVYQTAKSQDENTTCRPAPPSSTSDEDLSASTSLSNPTSPRRDSLKVTRKISKYSKKLASKRVQHSGGSDSAPSEDEAKDTKEIVLKNFVKSPHRSLKNTNNRSPFADKLISIPSTRNNDILESALPAPPPRKLYSEVLRMQPQSKELAVDNKISEDKSICKSAESSETKVDGAPMILVANASDEQTDEQRDDDVDDHNENPEDDHNDQQQQIRSSSALSNRQLYLNRLHYLNRSAQKLEQRKFCDYAKRNLLGRINKAREINSRNKPQRRSDMMQRHSGVNNNRKCF